MKAARLYGPRQVRVEDVPSPPATGGDVLLRVRAVGLCGSDLHYYRGGRIGDSLAAEPLVLGHEFAAEVIQAPAGAPGLHRGALVAVDPADACGACESCLHGHPNLCPAIRFCGTPPTDGALRERIAWPAHLLYPLPAGMTAEHGALLEPLGVLVHALDLAKVRLADTVAVLGAGSIGLLAIRLARLSGAVRVLATDLIPARLDAARAYGAHEVLDVRGRPADEVGRWIRQETGGRGVDVAIECAGAPDTPRQAVDAVRPGGRVVLVGIPEDDHIELAAAPARRKGVTVKLCRRMKHTYPRSIALVQAGLVDLGPLVTHRFGLDETPRAFEVLDRNAGDAIKAVIAL